MTYDIQESADDLSIFIVSNTGVGEPTGEAFTLEDANGFFGIWQPDPVVPLHVQSPSGQNASLSVQNPVAPPAGDVAMFRLINTGANTVRFVVDAGGSIWTFDNAPGVNPGSGINSGLFRISKVGTGVAEFSVDGFGNGYFFGSSVAVNHINTSSRRSKTDFAPVDDRALLAKLVAMPISQWRYATEPAGTAHVGPVAEDFQTALGLGDGEHISTVDASGVALAALKGLHRVVHEAVERKDAEIAALKQANTELAERLAAIEAALAARN